MDAEVAKAYESLGPEDRIVVGAMIMSLHQKDVENRKLRKAVMEQLKRADDLELRLSNSEASD